MKYSNMSRAAAAVIFILISISTMTAMGKADDSEPESVSGLENWDHSMDLSELPPGEYNIILRGTDRAGNIGVGGPYNIYVDPSIQIPSVSISNPVEGSRVGRLVHVVGTASDDKQVDRVEIAVDEGNFNPVDGTSFWSVSLDSSSWDDGLHVIKARSRDEAGNESPEAAVSFFKDTGKPFIEISSHKNGSYISGRIELKGTITDLNGIKQGGFSENDDRMFLPLKLSKSKVDGQWNYSRKIDTRTVSDGAHVYWIEAVDGLGAKSRQSFLFYVDNSSPELELFSPSEGELVNGQITLIGRVQDSVGVAGLHYKADNGMEGDVALSPGNPVWILPLDYSGFKGKEARVKMVLTDIVGNQVDEEYRILLDKEADLPLPGLSENRSSHIYTGTPVLTGLIIDDDGPEGRIEYSLNHAEWNQIDVSGAWSLSLNDAVSGANTVELQAVDKNGLIGKAITIEINLELPKPVIVLESFQVAEQVEPWYPGRVLDSKAPGAISGVVLNADAVRNLSWSLNGGGEQNLQLKPGAEVGEKVFFIKLPKAVESGRMNISVYGRDAASNNFGTETVYYNYQKPEIEEGASEPEYVIPDKSGIHLITPDSTAISSYILLGPGKTISGWTAGAEIKSAEFSEGGDFLSVETSGSGFRIQAVSEGHADDLLLTLVLNDGKTLISDPMSIAAGDSLPDIDVENLSAGMITGNELNITASASDNTGSLRLYYSLDGGNSFTELELEETHYTSVVSLSDMSDGLVDLVLKAEDIIGNSKFVYLPLLKDTEAPEVEFVTSSFGKGAEQITYSGRISDKDIVESLVFSFLPPSDIADAEPETYSAELNGDMFYLDVNLTSFGFEPADVIFSAIDRAGNRRDLELKLNVDIKEGRPLVSIQVPEEMGASETGFNLSGLIIDKEGIESILYSLNDGPFLDAGDGSLFTVPLKLEQMLDNLNTVSVKARDVNGLESETVSRNFLISLEEPEVSLTEPGLDAVTRGIVLLSGTAFDVNGISSIAVSHDNGNTFQRAEGAEEWSYPLDTALMDDGVSSLLIKAEDRAGVTGYYNSLINVDNTAPEISFSHPSEGEKVRGKLALSGRAVDNSGISLLRIIMTPLENDSAAENIWEISSRGTILEDIDLKGLAPGSYSFRAESVDAADNISTVSRVIELLPETMLPPVLLSPLPGEVLSPRFSIQGYLPDFSAKILLLVNGEIFKAVDVKDNEYFRYDVLDEDNFPEGSSRLSLQIEGVDGSLQSESVQVEYSKEGLWTSIDNLSSNQYISDRFVIEGSAGYETGIEDPKVLKELRPKSIGISFNGGKSFENLRLKDGKWKFTLYSEDIPDGDINILVQSSNGTDIAYTRCKAIMDSRTPELALYYPEESAQLFGTLFFSGAASDEGGLTGVSLSLREGGKDSYETPSFIQGMYFDASALGATYFTAGLGLTFIEDNVKLQVQYGYAPTTVVDPETNQERASRFGGNVFGAKLLANLAQLPFSWLLGQEFSALSASAALGANFSYFSSNSVSDEDSWGVILAGVIGQLEFPKISFPERKFIKYVSVFWEAQLWLISSDVSPEVTLLPSAGIRLGLF